MFFEYTDPELGMCYNIIYIFNYFSIGFVKYKGPWIGDVLQHVIIIVVLYSSSITDPKLGMCYNM